MRLLSKSTAVIAAAMAIAAANVWIATRPPSPEPIFVTDKPIELPNETTPSQSLPAMIEATQLTARPIFRASRRPWVAPPIPETLQPQPVAAAEPAPVAAPVQQVSDLQVSFLGLRIYPDGEEVLIARPGEPVPLWVRIGDDVGGWTLTAIDSNSAKFIAGEATRTIELHELPPGGALVQ